MKTLDAPIEVERLKLDEINPRLPEDVQGHGQSTILAYLYANDVLEELIDSYIANGYFVAEPILVLPPGDDDKRVVVEGNRRVAALMILLQLPAAVEAEISPTEEQERDLSPERRAQLQRIPAVEVANHDELADYLGFRHISGLKMWEPEAKARWIYLEVERAREGGSEDPFYEVGRRVGSNARGVRSAYNSYNILRYGRDVLKKEQSVQYVMKHRFGVWTRLLGTANVAQYIGLPERVIDYESAKTQVEQLDEGRFDEVIADLIPQGERRKAVLEDSRDATAYSTVIGNERARETLRAYGNLKLAAEVAELGDLAPRLRTVIASIENLILDVSKYQITKEDSDAGQELFGAARTLRGAIDSALDGDGS